MEHCNIEQFLKPDATEKERQNILNITPCDQDPVIYWHQVAVDAIHARERSEERIKERNEEYERLKQYEQSERKRVEHDLIGQTIPSFRNLLSRVENGDFSMNVQLSFYPNVERKEV